MKFIKLQSSKFLSLRFDKDSIQWLWTTLMRRTSNEFCYASSLSAATNRFKLKTVSDILDYWYIGKKIESAPHLRWHNWMYVGCIIHSFKRLDSNEGRINITMLDKKLGLEKFEVFKKLPSMTQNEISNLLRNPVLLCNQEIHILNGFHRLFSTMKLRIETSREWDISYEISQLPCPKCLTKN